MVRIKLDDILSSVTSSHNVGLSGGSKSAVEDALSVARAILTGKDKTVIGFKSIAPSENEYGPNRKLTKKNRIITYETRLANLGEYVAQLADYYDATEMEEIIKTVKAQVHAFQSYAQSTRDARHKSYVEKKIELIESTQPDYAQLLKHDRAMHRQKNKYKSLKANLSHFSATAHSRANASLTLARVKSLENEVLPEIPTDYNSNRVAYSLPRMVESVKVTTEVPQSFDTPNYQAAQLGAATLEPEKPVASIIQPSIRDMNKIVDSQLSPAPVPYESPLSHVPIPLSDDTSPIKTVTPEVVYAKPNSNSDVSPISTGPVIDVSAEHPRLVLEAVEPHYVAPFQAATPNTSLPKYQIAAGDVPGQHEFCFTYGPLFGPLNARAVMSYIYARPKVTLAPEEASSPIVPLTGMEKIKAKVRNAVDSLHDTFVAHSPVYAGVDEVLQLCQDDFAHAWNGVKPHLAYFANKMAGQDVSRANLPPLEDAYKAIFPGPSIVFGTIELVKSAWSDVRDVSDKLESKLGYPQPVTVHRELPLVTSNTYRAINAMRAGLGRMVGYFAGNGNHQIPNFIPSQSVVEKNSSG